MPALITQLCRLVIPAAFNAAGTTALYVFLEKFLDIVRAALRDEGGLTENEIDEGLSNEVIAGLATFGITIIALKSRLPLRILDKLGFKGSKTKKTAAGEAAAAKAGKAAAAISSRITLGRTALISFVAAVPPFLLWLPSTIINVLDQGVFQPAQINRILDAVGAPAGLRFPTADVLESPPPFTATSFKDYATSIETQGVVGINDPFKAQTVVYSRTALAELVFAVYGSKAFDGVRLTETKIIPEIAKYLLRRGQTFTPIVGASSSSPAAASLPTSASSQSIQVFSGVVVNGTLGTPAEFAVRENDMIDGIDELRQSAKINLAAFATSLPGRLLFEVAIVPSVKTAAGFTQKGEAVRVVSGYNKDGSPRYKTVYHKFAVMRVVVKDQGGTNRKLAEINLGPVNAVDFQPAAAQLQQLTNVIGSELFTTSLQDVAQIASESPIPQVSEVGAPNIKPGSQSLPSANSEVAAVSETAAYEAPQLDTYLRTNTPGSTLNLRADHSTAAAVIASIPHGSTLKSNALQAFWNENRWWAAVVFNGREGWVALEYTEPAGSSSSSAGTFSGTSAPNPAASAPAESVDELGLTKKQRKEYDQLRAAGAPKDLALQAARLIPA